MIEIKNLYYKYPRENNFALKNISLTINVGEKIAIIGDNGSGKSTLAKVLIGLVRPASGSVVIDSIELNKNNLLAIRRKVGMVFQNPNSQFIGANAEEDIAFGLETRTESRQEAQDKVRKISQELDLTTKLNMDPKKLSGGQRQRVAIASTLVLEPEYLVFDEITSMLDTKSKNDVNGLIHSLNNEVNKTIISITHNMDEAALATRVIVLSKGEIIADGDPQKILVSNNKINFLNPSFELEISQKLKLKPTISMQGIVEQLCK